MAEPRTTWRDIADALRAAIAGGEYAPGARLPSRARLMAEYGVAPQTVVNAINALRAEGLVTGIPGSGWYVRRKRPVMRLARSRLSRAERRAGRGTFTTDAHTGGWGRPGRRRRARRAGAGRRRCDAPTSTRAPRCWFGMRVMFANEVPVQLATSYLPRDLTAGTVIEQEDTGPGGVYARLEEAGHVLTGFTEAVRIGQAAEQEAEQLGVPVGAALFRIRRTAHAATRPVEVNFITAVGDRYELYYELPAE